MLPNTLQRPKSSSLQAHPRTTKLKAFFLVLLACLFIQSALCESVIAKTLPETRKSQTYPSSKFRKKLEKNEKLKRELPNIYANLWKAGSVLNHQKRKFYPLIIENNSALEAFSDGKRVIITRGLVEILNDEDEAAMILSHEISHTLLGHVFANKTQKQKGTLSVPTQNISSLQYTGKKRRMSYVKKFECEADYMSVYLMARAGYSIDNIGNSWKRIATLLPPTPEHIVAKTHPTRKERLAILLETQKEINDKTQSNLELLPNFITG